MNLLTRVRVLSERKVSLTHEIMRKVLRNPDVVNKDVAVMLGISIAYFYKKKRLCNFSYEELEKIVLFMENKKTP